MIFKYSFHKKIFFLSLRKIFQVQVQKMYMKLPWIDISKEFCQLEWENHLIAGYSHTRNSSEVFPVHNGHTICSKVYLFIVLKRCLGGHDSIFCVVFLKNQREKPCTAYWENDDTSHYKSPGTSRRSSSNNFFNCFAFEIYDTGTVSFSHQLWHY